MPPAASSAGSVAAAMVPPSGTSHLPHPERSASERGRVRAHECAATSDGYDRGTYARHEERDHEQGRRGRERSRDEPCRPERGPAENCKARPGTIDDDARGDEREPRAEEAHGQHGARLRENEAVGLAELRPDGRRPEACERDRCLRGAGADEEQPEPRETGLPSLDLVAMDRQAIARAQRRRQATEALEFERARAEALRDRLETVVAELDGAAIDEAAFAAMAPEQAAVVRVELYGEEPEQPDDEWMPFEADDPDADPVLDPDEQEEEIARLQDKIAKSFRRPRPSRPTSRQSARASRGCMSRRARA